jgi:hypothetical protein
VVEECPVRLSLKARLDDLHTAKRRFEQRFHSWNGNCLALDP